MTFCLLSESKSQNAKQCRWILKCCLHIVWALSTFLVSTWYPKCCHTNVLKVAEASSMLTSPSHSAFHLNEKYRPSIQSLLYIILKVDKEQNEMIKFLKLQPLLYSVKTGDACNTVKWSMSIHHKQMLTMRLGRLNGAYLIRNVP